MSVQNRIDRKANSIVGYTEQESDFNTACPKIKMAIQTLGQAQKIRVMAEFSIVHFNFHSS